MRKLRKLLLVVGSGLAVGAGVTFALGSGDSEGGNDGYLVRAVFDNSSFLVSGEDVKIAGVVVGAIHDIELTDNNKAAVVLRIDDPAFVPFRADASCQVGLQSLIGEQYVECRPTKPRADGAPLPGELPEIQDGDGAGQYLLPVEQTSSPVGVDLLNNIMRLPQRDRFRLIIAELGAGLAANGDSLRAALKRASPALQQTNRVVGVLADQNRLLARLVDESDQVLRPWAAQRKSFGNFISRSGELAVATAERGDDLEASFARFPAFLRELRPAADRFSALADEMTPALTALHANAPTINESVQRLGDFTEASTPAMKTLGDVADQGRETFPQINAMAQQLRALGIPLRPVARNVAALASSFDDAGGIEELMRFIYFYTGAVNGKDELGHYTRGFANINACVDRTDTPVGGCEATFDKTGFSSARAAPATAGSSAAPAATTAASADSQQQLLEYLLGDDG